MTDKLKAKLKELIENGTIHTDSDIEDFCEEHHANIGAVYQQISQWNTPECCKDCEYVQFYDNSYPCNACCRGKKDMYKKGR